MEELEEQLNEIYAYMGNETEDKIKLDNQNVKQTVE